MRGSPVKRTFVAGQTTTPLVAGEMTAFRERHYVQSWIDSSEQYFRPTLCNLRVPSCGLIVVLRYLLYNDRCSYRK